MVLFLVDKDVAIFNCVLSEKVPCLILWVNMCRVLVEMSYHACTWKKKATIWILKTEFGKGLLECSVILIQFWFLLFMWRKSIIYVITNITILALYIQIVWLSVVYKYLDFYCKTGLSLLYPIYHPVCLL